MSRNLGALTLLDPSGPAWPVMGVLYLIYIYIYIYIGCAKKCIHILRKEKTVLK
jgi:hypothetical protein